MLADADPSRDCLADLTRPDDDDDVLQAAPLVGLTFGVGGALWRGDLVDGSQRVEAARVADEREQLGDDLDQPAAVVADVEVAGDVALTCGSQPPWAASRTKVSSSRVARSIPVRV